MDMDVLAERIAAAPFAPETWPDVLIEVAEAGGGWSGQIVGVADGEFCFDIYGGFSGDLADELSRRGGADPAISPRPAALLRAEPMKLLCDADYLSPAARARSAIYREFFERVDGHYCTNAVLARTPDIVVGLAVNHSRIQGPPSEESRRKILALLPYLRAAAALQMRVEDQSAALALETLDALSVPALLCDFAGRIVALTAAAEEMLAEGDLVVRRGGRLCAVAPLYDAALQDALARARGAALLRSADAAKTRVADVTPLPRGAFGFRVGARALVTLGGPTLKRSLQTLQALGLTAAEAQVARAIAAGDRPAQIAARRAVSVETVRSQIKSIHAKLGVNRQVELVEMLRHVL